MEGDENIPMLLAFYFGEAAEAARRGASERLLGWCQAYDEWLRERKRSYGPNTVKQSVMAWRRLAQQSGKMPWELTQADIEQHAAWMQAEGYSPATTGCALGIFSNFYRWCSERQVDQECQVGFNPAEKVKRPKVRRYGGAKLLSRVEASRLLRTMQRDPSELGKRDFAFTLARLRLGAPLEGLRQLKWGQIEHDPEGEWVRWRGGGAERDHLPGEVWEAIRAALEASGRLAGMREGDYLFVPLVDPLKADTGRRAEDWVAGKCLSTRQILSSLKQYGRLAGIEEGKLTMMALRRTAMRLRLEAGASLGEMQVFLDSHEGARFTKYRLGWLPELQSDEDGCKEGEENEDRMPSHKGKPFKPGEGVTHGMYARSQPPQAVEAVLRENIQGIEEEIVGMRILARGLLERQGQTRNDQDAIRLMEAYTLAAFRLGEVIKAEKELAVSGKTSEWVEESLAMMDRFAIEAGREPISDQVRKGALGGEPGLEVGDRKLVEEIAAMRYVLRNVYRLAIEAEETREHIRLVEIHSNGCERLVKLLRMEKAGTDRLETFLKEGIQQAIKEVSQELGLSARYGG